MLTSDVRWSEGASSFGRGGPSTSRASPVDSDSRYICEDWISGLSNKKLGFITHEYMLEHLTHWATKNERPYIPSHDYMTFSEVILKTGGLPSSSPFYCPSP